MAAISDLNFEAGLAGLASGQSTLWGFRSGDRGTHTSRTIMLDELSHLLGAVPGDAAREDSGSTRSIHSPQCMLPEAAADR